MVDTINNHFAGVGQIQKIYSSATTVDLAIRLPGKTVHLYIGRGGGTEGVWLSENRIPSVLRKKDKFLEYLRRYLSGCTVQGLKLDEKDRCVQLKYGRAGKLCSFNIFYAGRDLYFSNRYFDDKTSTMRFFKSWSNTTSICEEDHEHQNNFKDFDEVGRITIPKEKLHQNIIDIEPILKKEFERVERSQLSKRKTQFLKRKINKIKVDLEKINKSENLIKLANDENEDFSKLNRKIKICGVKFNFDGDTHYQRRDEIFQKAKRFKQHQSKLIQRLIETERELKLLSSKTDYQNNLKCIAPVWIMKKSTSDEVRVVQDQAYSIHSSNGVDYGVGNSATGNDQLRKNWAKKDDFWFHLESGISSHVIVKLRGHHLNELVFKQVANLMNQAMKTKNTEIDLIYTQVKNLKGVKGTKGKVIFKKEKHIRVHL